MAKEPKEVLEEQWATTAVFQRLTERHHGGHEEAGADQFIQQQHDGADKKSGKRQKSQNGRHH